MGEHSLFSACAQLLGKPADSAESVELANILQTKPSTIAVNDHVTFYTFNDHGLELVFSTERTSCKAFVLFVDSPNVRSGSIQKYSGDFPYGVSAGDTVGEVESKIGLVPLKQEIDGETSLTYQISNMKLMFHFNEEGKLSTVTAKLTAA